MHTLVRLRNDPQFLPNVVAWERLPARAARYGPVPAALHPALQEALAQRGLRTLYAHQTQAIEAALRGENVVVATGTASGKTLCFNVPILQACLTQPNARALYLFPTKALTQDQASELQTFTHALAPAAPSLQLAIYDGDTPAARRTAARQNAQLLLTNPDMLHAGILPHHPKWAALLANLKYVVLDELHVYRGVFGSHTANVLRRLKRLCAFYGAHPQFICASATIANPRELAETLLEAPVTLVADDASPRAEKHFLLYNPPLTDAELGMRRSYLLEAQRVANEFLADGVQTAVFARTRNATELLLSYVRDSAAMRALDPQTLRGYRGGYLPTERRTIEQGLRSGAVRGVVATNALELGVDIGQLGAVVIAGYPGTLASLWQQAGRAGRRTETSAVVMVASAAPLDQYLMAHPRFVFERSPEHARLNPNNLAIVLSHIRCATFELPWAEGESFGLFKETRELLEALYDLGEVHVSMRGETPHRRYHWVAAAYPAARISLRAAGHDTVLIQDTSAGRPKVIGEVERTSAPLRVHEGAVYLHEGQQYLVTRLDWENGLAEVQPSNVDYFTEASETVEIEVENVTDAVQLLDAAQLPHAWGQLHITSQPTTFRQVKRYTHETLGHGEILLPPRDFHTTGYWFWLAPEQLRRLAEVGVFIGPNHYGPNWAKQRAAVRARDGYRCRNCGAAETPAREHDVHHLTPFRSFGYIPDINDNYLQANVLENLVTLCRACHARVESARGTQTAWGGLAHALGNLAPLFLMCDPRDIGVLSEMRAKETNAPTITLYDLVSEGLGFAEQLYALHDELLRDAHALIRACPCREGCPACVGPVGAIGAANADNHDVKVLTLKLTEYLSTPH